MAQPLPTYGGALSTIALGALSVSIVIGHTNALGRVIAAAISIALYCPKVYGC